MDSHKPFGLHFGTAGLRGTVGDGDDQMNVANVKRATAGLAAYLGPDSRVVVGCDARHGSAEFYDAALKVLSGAGVHAIGLTPKRPTPVTAFAVKFLQADAGIMITASHNPPEYNGYKVYLSDGIQIVPPADADIAAAIETAPVDPPLSTDLIERCDVTDEFIAAAVGMCQTADANAKAGLKIVVADARRGRCNSRKRTEEGGVRRRGVRRQANGTRPGLPHRAVPQPRGTRGARFGA